MSHIHQLVDLKLYDRVGPCMKNITIFKIKTQIKIKQKVYEINLFLLLL